AEDGIRDLTVTGVQTCALPIFASHLVPVKTGIPFLHIITLPKLKLVSRESSIRNNSPFTLQQAQGEKFYVLPDSLKSDSTFTTIKDTSKSVLTKKEKSFRMRKSPLVATLLSAVVPGAGQFYNQS